MGASFDICNIYIQYSRFGSAFCVMDIQFYFLRAGSALLVIFISKTPEEGFIVKLVRVVFALEL